MQNDDRLPLFHTVQIPLPLQQQQQPGRPAGRFWSGTNDAAITWSGAFGLDDLKYIIPEQVGGHGPVSEPMHDVDSKC